MNEEHAGKWEKGLQIEARGNRSDDVFEGVDTLLLLRGSWPAPNLHKYSPSRNLSSLFYLSMWFTLTYSFTVVTVRTIPSGVFREGAGLTEALPQPKSNLKNWFCRHEAFWMTLSDLPFRRTKSLKSSNDLHIWILKNKMKNLGCLKWNSITKKIRPRDLN
jgi:hypothetical protein